MELHPRDSHLIMDQISTWHASLTLMAVWRFKMKIKYWPHILEVKTTLFLRRLLNFHLQDPAKNCSYLKKYLIFSPE